MKGIYTLAMLFAALVSGCSTIISDSDYPVAVNSNPSGASFVITNKAGEQVHSAETPSTVTLAAGAGYFKSEVYTITLNLDGYSTKVYTLEASRDGWYWGNIVFGGFIGGLIVDPLTGAMYKLPDSVNITLDASSATSDEARTFTIATIDSLSEEQRQLLEPIQ